MPRLRVPVAPARQMSPRILLTTRPAPLFLLIREGRTRCNPVQVRKANNGSVYGDDAVAGLVVRMHRYEA
jgi:hypothetical protein